jgi:hypothetical protein
VDLFNCTINETNTQIPDITIADKFDLPAGGTEVTNMRASDQCTTLEAGGEPDTATITCDCGDPINPFDTVSASDDSDFSCEDCVVTIDKQVSCDGTNYFDIGNDGDGLGQLPDCQELDGQGVHAQYIVDNTGDTDVRCTIGDSNDEFLIGSETTGTIPGQGGQYVSSRKDAVCSDVFDEKEPDTATLNCECLIDNEVVATRSDTDIANIECLGCDVKVDKAVSCAGEPFDDETLVFANEDLTNGCTALNDENITVNYRGQNVGEVGLFDCKIDESNTVLGTGMQTSFGISVNTTEGPFIDDDQDCSDPTLDDGEPDTATINCVCEDPAGDAILEGPVMVSAFDIADFICEEVPQGCRMTGGHNVMVTKKEGGDPQYDDIPSGTKYTTGGQIGAPDEAGCAEYPAKGKCVDGVCTGGWNAGLACEDNGECPNQGGRNSGRPWGNWQHNHHSGPDDGFILGGSFSFHSGTAAAPDEAFIKSIICADEGWCVQARPAPTKQIFWEGTGVFHKER